MRYAAYIRVSDLKKREEEAVVAKQHKNITDWEAGRPDDEVVTWHKDINITGSKMADHREGLHAALKEVRAGKTDGLIVAFLDRMSRAKLSDGFKFVEEFEDLGAPLVMLDLGPNPITEGHKPAVINMLWLAHEQWKRYRKNYQDAQDRAIEDGKVLGKEVSGYLRPMKEAGEDEDGNVIRKVVPGPYMVDEGRAPLIKEMFELRLRGWSQQRIAEAVNRHGIPSILGNRWTASTVGRILSYRVYLGEYRWGKYVKRNAHPALVDEETFEAVQRMRSIKATPINDVLLRGLVFCASCRYALSPVRATRGRRDGIHYVCTGRGRGYCDSGSHVSGHDYSAQSNRPPVNLQRFQEHGESIRKAILAGATQAEAARKHGLPRHVVNRWLTRGRADPESVYGPFTKAVDGHYSLFPAVNGKYKTGPKPSGRPERVPKPGGPNITGLHSWVVDKLFEALPGLRKAAAADNNPEIKRLKEQEDIAQAELQSALRHRDELEKAAGKDAMLKELARLRRAAEGTQRQLRAAQARNARVLPDEVRYLTRERWDEFSVEEQNQMLHHVIHAVFVRHGQRRTLSDARVKIVWRNDPDFDPLVDLPRPGNFGSGGKKFVPRPFTW